jgi:hypothetical protein
VLIDEISHGIDGHLRAEQHHEGFHQVHMPPASFEGVVDSSGIILYIESTVTQNANPSPPAWLPEQSTNSFCG